MCMAATLVMWPGPFEQTFIPPSHRSSICNMTLIGPVVSEEKMFKECGRRRWRPTYPVSSPVSHTSVVVPYCYLFLLSVFILWFSYYVSDIFCKFQGSWMTTYLGKSCSFGLPRVPFVNCRQFMYLVISLLVLRAGCGIWLYQFLIIAYRFTFQVS